MTNLELPSNTEDQIQRTKKIENQWTKFLTIGPKKTITIQPIIKQVLYLLGLKPSMYVTQVYTLYEKL